MDCTTCGEKKYYVFVFGSNEAGRHDKGAALHAIQCHGARYGRGVGRWYSCYAIPTKDRDLKTLPLESIKKYVTDFLEYARTFPDVRFNVTRIGCGLAGYTDEQIAPMFTGSPINVYLPKGW